MSVADHQVPVSSMGNSDLFRSILNAILLDLAGSDGTGATTNASATTVLTIPIPANSAVLIEAEAVGHRTGGAAGAAGDSAGYKLYALAKNISGTVTIVSQSLAFASESQAAWDFAAVVSTTNILLKVTGAVNNNVSWTIHARTRSA